MLSKIRRKIEGVMRLIAKPLCSLGVHPNLLTISSSFILLVGLFLFKLLGSVWIFILSIAFSGFLDALDGAVARACGKASVFGSFLDSTIDRVNDFLIIASLSILGFNEYLVFGLMSLAFLTSYVRAKAESLGLRIEGVGLVERAERILLITAILIINNWSRSIALLLLYTALVLSFITVVQRIVHVRRSLGRSGL
ncbi:MAG: archaetidylinositol phosphate synthase [Thermosphaera sp.]